MPQLKLLRSCLAVQGSRHPPLDGVENPPLHIGDELAGVSLKPAPVQLLGRIAELDDQVAGQVLGLDLAAFFPPEAVQGGFVVAHNDPGIGAADESAAFFLAVCLHV